MAKVGRPFGPPVKDRILSKIKKDENGCWIFTGVKMSTGYGGIWKDGKHVAAHRESYRIFCGDLSDEEVVCHKCDVRPCVNPEHLFKGTRADNNKDMRDKKRHRFGETSPRATLTENDVKFIRSSSLEGVELAVMFGIGKTAISKIRNGKRWAHSFEG